MPRTCPSSSATSTVVSAMLRRVASSDHHVANPCSTYAGPAKSS